jgi:hypothetical protein
MRYRLFHYRYLEFDFIFPLFLSVAFDLSVKAYLINSYRIKVISPFNCRLPLDLSSNSTSIT